MRFFRVFAFVLLVAAACFSQSNSLANSQMPSVIVVPPEAQPSLNFNADAATEAYLAQIPAAARARSDAYFEGGYWLILWDFLYGAAGPPKCATSRSASRVSGSSMTSFIGLSTH